MDEWRVIRPKCNLGTRRATPLLLLAHGHRSNFRRTQDVNSSRSCAEKDTISRRCSVLQYWGGACCIYIVSVGLAQAQTDISREGFEVASIRRCSSDSAPGDRGGGNVGEPSPEILNLNCQTVIGLIRMAF